MRTVSDWDWLESGPRLTPERELELYQRWDDPEVRKEVISAWIDYAGKWSIHFCRKWNCWNFHNDLLQECCLALVRAAETFDPSSGCRFSTYATAAMRWGGVHFMRNQRSTVSVPDMPWRIDRGTGQKRYYCNNREFANQIVAAMNARSLSVFDYDGGVAETVPQLSHLCQGLQEVDDRDERDHHQRALLEAIRTAGLSDRNVAVALAWSDGESSTQMCQRMGLGICKERVRQIREGVIKKLREGGKLCLSPTGIVESQRTVRSRVDYRLLTSINPSKITSRRTSVRPTSGGVSTRKLVVCRPTGKRSTTAPLAKFFPRNSRKATCSSSTS